MTILEAIQENRDHVFALKIREHFGQTGRLLSWTLQENGRWLARLSCPSLPDTIERTGKTRRDAIEAAGREMSKLLHQRVMSAHESRSSHPGPKD